ncbi:MAG: ACT domain-containing protein [Oscillospiraceae bacterium]|nr:ACT domain-containing protein [Oscillospiraceae bacterium]
MQAVISVVGRDKVGILKDVATKCADHNVNVIDVSQTVLQDMFTMIMLVDISNIDVKFGDFSAEMESYGSEIGMQIRAMHEDIFNSMHRI